MIAIIDYGAGNIHSISRGLQAAGAETKIIESGIDSGEFDALVLPGVGHAGHLMQSLRDRRFDQLILDSVAVGIPFLGICVGLQIMYGKQEEGDTHGLGLLPGDVVHLPKSLKTPHMGWSLVTATQSSRYAPVGSSDYFYFVHSYAAANPADPFVVATTDYGATFPAVVIKDHLWGCQFHPEKSSTAGLAFLGAFVASVQSSARAQETLAVG